MNFTSMSYFIAVAEERSFTRAAERLSVTQQTLSANIANIERELGVRLLNRKVPLTLTYAGQVFLDYARRFQAAERAMSQEFRDISNDESGLLGVGVAATRGHMIMPRAIAAFRQDHPSINVLLWEEENQKLIELLREGRVDMIVAIVPPGEAGLVVHRMYREKIVLLVSDELLDDTYGDGARRRVAEAGRSHDLAPLGELPYMLLGRDDEPGTLARAMLRASGIEPRVSVQSRNSETLCDLAVRGVGACFVPMGLVEEHFGNWRARGLDVIDLGPKAYIDISCAWRDTDHVWSVITSFYQVVEGQNGGRDMPGARVGAGR